MSKWGSNGALMYLSYLSSDPSSRRSGILTLLMPPTSLCYGQEYCRGGYVGLPCIVVVLMTCIINACGVIRLAGNPTLDLQRKYFTMIYMTVRSIGPLPGRPLLTMPISSSSVTLSHAVTPISRTPRMSRPQSILFLASSNRQSSSLLHCLFSALTRTHSLLYVGWQT